MDRNWNKQHHSDLNQASHAEISLQTHLYLVPLDGDGDPVVGGEGNGEQGRGHEAEDGGEGEGDGAAEAHGAHL